MFLFYVFWEVQLIPMYLMIGIWGGPNRVFATMKFFLYTFAGSVLMMVAIMALYFLNHHYTGVYTSDMVKLMSTPLPAHHGCPGLTLKLLRQARFCLQASC